MSNNKKHYVISLLLILVTVGFLAALLVVRPAQVALAFPTNTNVLDNFNRADALLSGSTASNSDTWTDNLALSSCDLNIAGNQVRGNSGYCSGFMNNTYGPDSEIYADVPAIGNTGTEEVVALFARIVNPTTSSITAYYVEAQVDGDWVFVRVNSSSQQVVLATNTKSFSAGDSVGFSVEGTSSPVSLKAWHKPSGGSWVQVGATITDSFSATPPASNTPFLGSGRLGVEMFNNTSTRIDNFSGGTVVTNSPPAAPTLISPIGSIAGISNRPSFQLRTTDAEDTAVIYKIDVCSNSDCSSIYATTNSQEQVGEGWALEEYPVSTVLANSQIAIYDYFINPGTPALSPNTQYWWRAYAKDPIGTNTYGAASTIDSFITGDNEVRIQGGVNVHGGTKISN